MANSTIIPGGQINGAGATDALFLKVWSGEVLTTFQTLCKTADKQYTRTIASGKSAQFPATGRVTANYHTPGAELVGQSANNAERVIVIDDQLIADVFIANIDEAKSHYDYRSIYSKETGAALARTWDKNSLQVMVLAARSAATVTGNFGGTSLTSAGTLYKTSAVDLVAGLFAASQAMDEKDIPEDEVKYAYLRPAQYYLLTQTASTGTTPNLVDRDFSDNNGDYAKAEVRMAGGCMLVKTNNLPNTNVTTGVAKYQGDFSKTAAVVTTTAAIGTVKLIDLKTEMEYDMRRQGHLILSKYAVGTDVLRPECAVELRTTT